MRAVAAIASSLVAAAAMPGCGGAGAPSHTGAVPLSGLAPKGGRPRRAEARRAAAPIEAATPTASARHRRRGARPVHPRPARRAAPGRPAVLPSPLLRAFPILRRPARSGDRPAGQARALLSADARERRRLGEGALLIAGARRLPPARGMPPSWIVPAPERVCLLRGVGVAADAPETIECVRVRAGARGYLMSSITGLPGARGRSSLEGVLPAGAAEPRLELADGQRIVLALREGSYAVTAAAATALRFERAGRELTVPVPRTPSGAGP